MNPLSIVFGLGVSIIDKLFPDPTKAAEAKLKLMELEQNGELQKITGQLEINKEEAKSSSTFVAGWRPFIGWVCGFALAYQFIIRPLGLAVWILTGHPNVVLPGLDSTLWELLFGMLGMGTLRSVEKIKGVAS